MAKAKSKAKVVAKKVDKKVAKSAPKKAVAKKTVAKAKPVKKVVIKKVAPKAKPAAKPSKAKAAPKKAIKAPAKKVVAKKITKPAPKKAVVAPVKKVVTKKVAAPVKPAKAAIVEKVVLPKAKMEAPVKVEKAPKPEKPAKEPKAPKPPKINKKDIKHPKVAPVKEVASPKMKDLPEPAGKFELEYVVRSSQELLYDMFTQPSGFSEWFCDDLNIRNGIHTFSWDGQESKAVMVKDIPDRLARYQWMEKNDGSYFEFRVEKDDLTGDISLIVTDFAEPQDTVSSKLLWDSQIEKLLSVIGSHF